MKFPAIMAEEVMTVKFASSPGISGGRSLLCQIVEMTLMTGNKQCVKVGWQK